MGTQQFCLKWNNHQLNMLSVFDHLLQNEAFVDVTLACEGLSLKAHKMVLSACSPYFQNLFMDNPCQHPIVILKDIQYNDMKSIIDFMYKGEVNVSQEQLTALLKTADTLKVKGLAEVSGQVTQSPVPETLSQQQQLQQQQPIQQQQQQQIPVPSKSPTPKRKRRHAPPSSPSAINTLHSNSSSSSSTSTPQPHIQSAVSFSSSALPKGSSSDDNVEPRHISKIKKTDRSNFEGVEDLVVAKLKEERLEDNSNDVNDITLESSQEHLEIDTDPSIMPYSNDGMDQENLSPMRNDNFTHSVSVPSTSQTGSSSETDSMLPSQNNVTFVPISRHYNRKWSIQSLEKAINHVLVNERSIHSVAIETGVPTETLRRYVHKVQHSFNHLALDHKPRFEVPRGYRSNRASSEDVKIVESRFATDFGLPSSPSLTLTPIDYDHAMPSLELREQEQFSIQLGPEPRMNMLHFMSYQQLLLIEDSVTSSRMISKLMDILFTKAELGTSSVTGRKTSRSIEDKKALDPIRTQLIADACYQSVEQQKKFMSTASSHSFWGNNDGSSTMVEPEPISMEDLFENEDETRIKLEEYVNLEHIDALEKIKTSGKLVNNLMNALFSKEELARSSVTGKKSPRSLEAKKALDPLRANLVIAFTHHKFPGESMVTIKQKMAQKCQCERLKRRGYE